MDVDVIEVAGLDEEYQSNFSKPYIVQDGYGDVVECDTEDEACELQRVHREIWGLDPMTGE